MLDIKPYLEELVKRSRKALIVKYEADGEAYSGVAKEQNLPDQSVTECKALDLEQYLGTNEKCVVPPQGLSNECSHM